MKVTQLRLATLMLFCLMLTPFQCKHMEGEVVNNTEGDISVNANTEVDANANLDT